MSQITLDVAERARLDQVLVGLAGPDGLAGSDGDVYVDEEGTPLARREDGAITPLQPPSWRRPAEVERCT